MPRQSRLADRVAGARGRGAVAPLEKARLGERLAVLAGAEQGDQAQVAGRRVGLGAVEQRDRGRVVATAHGVEAGDEALDVALRLRQRGEVDGLDPLPGVVGRGEYRPTDQSHDVFRTLSAETDDYLAALQELLATGIPAFNSLVRELEIPAVILKRGGGSHLIDC